MRFSEPGTRRATRSTLLVALTALVLSPLAIAQPAQAAVTDLVISEVYGGGGNSGAPLDSDFVELYNPTDADISLSGLSIQYRSATNTGTGLHLLSGTVKAKSHFLVAEASGGNGDPLPEPDASGTLAMSATNGTVFLASSTSLVTLTPGTSTGNAAVIDLVGWGSSNTFEGAAAGVLSNTTAASRNETRDDTDANNVDFTVGAPDPQTSSDSTVDPGPATEKTIQQIQGSAAESPLAGTRVITSGVVTAAYPSGGLRGFYVQTPGTGGPIDFDTHTGSDAVFVNLGSIAAASYPERGANVEVTGLVSEANGLTQVKVAAAEDLEVIPGEVEAPTPAEVAWPGGAAARETLEGMLYGPTGPWTVSEVYNLNSAAEIEIARGSTPLRTPTDVARPKTAAAAAVAAQNAARLLTLDDGATVNYFSTAKNTPLPWITASSSVRVGAPVAFVEPVVIDFRNGVWKAQPLTRLTADDTAGVTPATFGDTRTTKPDAVEGKLKVASFNVLNYFTQTAADWTGANAANTCTPFRDRANTPIAVDSCSGDGPRGAWDLTNRTRQQNKIVKAINALGADVVSLEEIENSAKYGPNRDAALSTLTDALNTDAGGDVWSFVASPNARPALADEDVIRTAFIYKSAKVDLVGPSKILVGSTAFGNAREPLAQVFKPEGGSANQQFIVVVNHFKSKGSGSGADADQGDGQGASNASRVNQAKALVDWVAQLKTNTATDRVFLTGDFNSYTQEDPMKVLYDAGYTDIGSTLANEYTYVFDGAVGSLDHVLGNAAAMDGVKGASVWNINSVESVAYEYSRFNYNATNFYVADPYRSSDHDPLVVGFDSPAADTSTVPLNLLNINDFHGRIDANTTAFATTVEQLREAGGEDNTLFLSAGDNIGASLFPSASADDNPTIDVLNALDLDAAAVGNHEFDKGFADLTGHVADRADWTYLGANVYEKGTTTPALPEYALLERGGLTIGVIGAVTQETPSLVTPGGITTLDFGDPVAAINRVANQLTDGNDANGEADVLVAELHEGAAEGIPEGSTIEEEIADSATFAHIVNDTSAKVDAIFTGHTHKQYAWDAPVPGQAGKTRPIMQTGEYGNNVGQVRLVVDKVTGDVESYSQTIVKRGTAVDTSYPRVQAVKDIYDAAKTASDAIGNQVKGSLTADITTAYSGGSYVDGKYVGPNPSDPKQGQGNRALESTIGNKVADALLDNLDENGAEIGVVNPGGLRDELLFAPDGKITYAEANAVLPFVNNLWTIDLTGAQFKQMLEQQWQPAGAQRPFLHLGLSKNVSVALDPSQPEGSRVRSVRVNGEPIDPAATYKIGTFSFLATGGDNFAAFKSGTNAVDTGKVDRDAWISFIEQNSPLSPDFDRRMVEGSGFPAEIGPGDAVSFGLSRLDLTSLGSPLNTTVTGKLDTPGADQDLGSFPVTAGAATIAFTAPATVPAGSSYVFTAQPSGTTVTIPAEASPVDPEATTTVATVSTVKPVVRSTEMLVRATVTDGDGPVDGGTAQVLDGDEVLASGPVEDGSALVRLPTFAEAGSVALTVRYLGTATHEPSDSADVTVTVVKATPTITTYLSGPVRKNVVSSLAIRVAAVNGTPTGYVSLREGDTILKVVPLVNGRVSVKLPKYSTTSTHTVVVTYLGNDYVKTGTKKVTFKVS